MPKNVKDDKSMLRKPESSQFIFTKFLIKYIFENNYMSEISTK